MREVNVSPAKQIRNLLIVVGAGVFGAFLLAYVMVVYYGPSGRYQTKNVLLEPGIIEGLTFQDLNPDTGKFSQYSMDRIELLYFEDVGNQWIRKALTLDTYRQIYEVISGDSSVMEVSDEIQGLFHLKTPATLSLVVRSETGDGAKAFQEVQFVNRGNYYRVLLREESKKQNWAYFYHPDIFNQVLQVVEQ